MTLKKDIETSIYDFIWNENVPGYDLNSAEDVYKLAKELTNKAVLPALKHHAKDPEGMLCDDPSDNPTVINIDELFEK